MIIAVCRSGEAIPQYVKSFVKKGGALMGLGRYREAVLAFEEGLQADPFCWELKKGLQEASDGVMKDLLSGKQQIYKKCSIFMACSVIMDLS